MKNTRFYSLMATSFVCLVGLTGCGSTTPSPTNTPKAISSAPTVQHSNDTVAKHSAKTQTASAPDNVDWSSFGGNVQQDRFSSDTEISPSTANKLHLTQAIPLGTATGPNESYPLEENGVLYVTTMQAKVMAISVASGHTLWTYTPKLHLLDGIPTINRGVAIGEGHVYVLTPDDRLIALNMKTGQLIYQVTVANESQGYFESMAPLYANGQVFIGSAGGDEGIRGFEAAYDATTGKRLWQTYTIPPRGQGWVPATGDHGGGAVWNIPAFNPQTGALYYGTGNPSPDFFGQARPGPDPMTDAVVDANATTGQVHWFQQEVQHDLWDYDVASPPLLFRVGNQLVVGEAGKNGDWYEWNAQTGKALIHPVAFVKEQHVTPTASGTPEWPGSDGGANYGPSAYNPLTHLVYVAGINGSETMYAKPTAHSSYRVDDGTAAVSAPKGQWTGTITAIDVTSGKTVWQHKTPTPPIGGVSVNAGGVVLYGEANGELTALSAADGHVVWQYQTGAPIGAAPIIYRYAKQTYVSVTVGGAGSLMGLFPYNGPNRVLTFRMG